MNVEIGTEAAQFPEKECISGIFLAVHILYKFSFIFKKMKNEKLCRFFTLLLNPIGVHAVQNEPA